ncbi:MAG: sulfite exporter TauE/SafE family protein [Solirubrobacterales bacterium]
MHDLSVAALVGLLVASAVGGVIQGAIGFGFALVAVPAIALVEPDAIPVTVMCMAVPMTIVMALRERSHIDVGGFATIMTGRVLGIAGGVVLLSVVPESGLSVLVGVMILLGVGLSVGGLDIQPQRWVNVGAGVLSGVMGTTSAIGGPALAVVYQHRPGPELRSTLALSYLAGIVIAVGALAAVGRVEGWHLKLALELVPALLAGLWLSFRLSSTLDRGWLRPAVLGFAAVSGVVIVIRGLV